MTYRKHPRHITDEQFADGTTIDGSRIDKAMEDVVEHVNNIPAGDLGRRFVQTQYVAGWQPCGFVGGVANLDLHNMPWLPVINYPATPGASQFPGSVADSAPQVIRNKHRFKGIEVPGIDYAISQSDTVTNNEATITGLQYAWSRPFHFSSPVIVHDVSIHMHADRGSDAYRPYRNTFQYNTMGPGPSPPPPGFQNGDGAHDLCVLLDVAHPFTPEDTRMRSVVLLSRGFNVPDSAFSMLGLGELPSTGVGYTDFHPAFVGGTRNDSQSTVGGIFHRLHDLSIPIPASSRCRLAVVIPEYDADVVGSTWGEHPGAAATPNPYKNPWASQSYSATLTVLEEVFSV